MLKMCLVNDLFIVDDNTLLFKIQGHVTQFWFW